MTTKDDEFMKMLQAMYDRGYVLVRIHDIAYEETDWKRQQTVCRKGKDHAARGQAAICDSPRMCVTTIHGRGRDLPAVL